MDVGVWYGVLAVAWILTGHVSVKFPGRTRDFFGDVDDDLGIQEYLPR